MNVAATIMAAELLFWVANFSVERIAAGGVCLPVRALWSRRHRSLHRWAPRHIVNILLLLITLLTIGYASSAEEVGTTGMWINDRRSPDEPLRTGMVWTNS